MAVRQSLVRIEAFDRQLRIDLVNPVIAAVTQEHPARFRVDRRPQPGVAPGPLGAEDNFEILAELKPEIAAIDLVVPGRLRHFVICARQRLAGGEGEDLAGPAIARDAIGEVAPNRRLDVDVVRIGLQRIDRVPQRRPVRMYVLRADVKSSSAKSPTL